MSEIARWLNALGLGKYADLFADNDISFDVLPNLNDQHLAELGISLGDRLRLRKAIDEIQCPPANVVDEAERRQVTVVFCDLVGSTRLSQRLDSEDYRDLLRAYQGCCKAAVERYDGYVARYVGDGVLTYFGYPQAHENDAERAVCAGLAIVEGVANLNDALEKPQDVNLSVRLGIATGQVIAGDLIGEAASEQRAIVGETPNLAARLEGRAQVNSVVIADGTRNLIAGRFDLQDLGYCELKGFAEPVKAWRVIRERETASRFEAFHPGPLTPLVGRTHELDLMVDRWRQAKGGEGQVVLLLGDAGIGKSRIAHALCERLDEEKLTLLRYQCSPHFNNSSLHPFIEQLRRAANFNAKHTEDERIGKLARLLDLSVESFNRRVPMVAALLSISVDNRYPVSGLSQQRQRKETLVTLVSHWKRLAQRYPLVVVFEDLHWADPSSLELLEMLIESIQYLPVLLVVTSRPEFRPDWAVHTHVTSITLNRFGRKLALAMVKEVAGRATLAHDAIEGIIARTDGVPLFIEELTHSTLKTQRLSTGIKQKGQSGPLEAVTIPMALYDSLMARLDRLPAAKEIAQTAAVIGREFSLKLLLELSPLEENQLMEALEQLIATGVVFKRGDLPEAVYSFKHALVRDAAYESILREKRKGYHRQIAEALKRSNFAAAADQPGLFARHYTEAGDKEEALRYWLQAGQSSAKHSAYHEAISYFRNGLAVLETLPQSPEHTRRTLDFQLALHRALTITTGWGSKESSITHKRISEICELLGETKQIPVGWLHHTMRGEHRLAQSAGTQALRFGEQHADIAMIIAAHRHLGWTALYRGKFELIPGHIDESLRLYAKHRDACQNAVSGNEFEHPDVAGLCVRLFYQWLVGFPEQASNTAEEAVLCARESDRTSALAYALTYAAQRAMIGRSADLAAEFARELMALAEEHGLTLYGSWSYIVAGWAAAKQGEWDNGITLLRRGIETYAEGGQMLFRPLFLTLLAELYLDGGRSDEARQSIHSAQRLMERSDERMWEAEIQRLYGEIDVRQNASDEAEVRFNRAIAIAQRQGARSLELRATTSLARLLRGTDRSTKALHTIYRKFSEGYGTSDLHEARALLDTTFRESL